MLVFACISPHAPILLPTVGSPTDRAKLGNTIQSLEKLGRQLTLANPDTIVITSPHPDWGIEVPKHLLIHNSKFTIHPILTTSDSPQEHFQQGRKIINEQDKKLRLGWIASADLSHRLKKDGPYGFHPSGPVFDKLLIKLLRDKDADGVLNLDSQLSDEAGECGLRSICMLLGALTASGQAWQTDILSYEGPFGVGYLVARLL